MYFPIVHQIKIVGKSFIKVFHTGKKKFKNYAAQKCATKSIFFKNKGLIVP